MDTWVIKTCSSCSIKLLECKLYCVLYLIEKWVIIPRQLKFILTLDFHGCLGAQVHEVHGHPCFVKWHHSQRPRPHCPWSGSMSVKTWSRLWTSLGCSLPLTMVSIHGYPRSVKWHHGHRPGTLRTWSRLHKMSKDLKI